MGPKWCEWAWTVLNGPGNDLKAHSTREGSCVSKAAVCTHPEPVRARHLMPPVTTRRRLPPPVATCRYLSPPDAACRRLLPSVLAVTRRLLFRATIGQFRNPDSVVASCDARLKASVGRAARVTFVWGQPDVTRASRDVKAAASFVGGGDATCGTILISREVWVRSRRPGFRAGPATSHTLPRNEERGSEAAFHTGRAFDLWERPRPLSECSQLFQTRIRPCAACQAGIAGSFAHRAYTRRHGTAYLSSRRPGRMSSPEDPSAPDQYEPNEASNFTKEPQLPDWTQAAQVALVGTVLPTAPPPHRFAVEERSRAKVGGAFAGLEGR
eukprot:365743-Chlamydomonas_euryale.AAC.8